jgi:hypothetical protein
MLVDKVLSYLSQKKLTLNEALRYEVENMAGVSFKRQFMSELEPVTKGKIRLSACGKCPRQNAYKFHGIETKGKEIDSRSRIVFFMGDMAEIAVTNIIKLAGVSLLATGLSQDEIKFQVNGSVVTGHPDGYFWADDELYLLEVKSMSSFSFERFERGDISDEYIAQINSYMHKRKSCVACCMVALNKDSGVLAEKMIYRDDSVVNKVRQNLLEVLHSTPETLPPPPPELGPDEKGYFSWKCLYCSARDTCREVGTKTELVLVKKSYKLKVKPCKSQELTSVSVEGSNPVSTTKAKMSQRKQEKSEGIPATASLSN